MLITVLYVKQLKNPKRKFLNYFKISEADTASVMVVGSIYSDRIHNFYLPRYRNKHSLKVECRKPLNVMSVI